MTVSPTASPQGPHPVDPSGSGSVTASHGSLWLRSSTPARTTTIHVRRTARESNTETGGSGQGAGWGGGRKQQQMRWSKQETNSSLVVVQLELGGEQLWISAVLNVCAEPASWWLCGFSRRRQLCEHGSLGRRSVVVPKPCAKTTV